MIATTVPIVSYSHYCNCTFICLTESTIPDVPSGINNLLCLIVDIW